MIVLGIDPGSVVTGFGLVKLQGNRYQVMDSGPVRLQKKGEFSKRLWFLFCELEQLIQVHNPHAIAVEKVFHGVNFSSALALGQVRGVVMSLAGKYDLPLYEYAPTEVKKAVTGYGRAEKQQVQEMVRVLLNLTTVPKPNDVADALAIAICHCHHFAYAKKVGLL